MATLIIGANGQIGRQLCELAIEAGEPVKAMVRDAAQCQWFDTRGIPSVVADLEGDFSHAFDGCDQVIFTAGSGPNTGADKTLLVDLYGAMRAVDAACESRFTRFLMVSAMRARDPQAAPEKLRPYMVAKFAADAYLRCSGLPFVIVQPGRLTNAPASRCVATTQAEADGIEVSRANVAHVLLHLLQRRDLTDRELVVLDGNQPISEAIG